MKYRFYLLALSVLACDPLLRAETPMDVVDHLASQHLPYIYGSGDLKNGGLDCSGFVQIVFRDSYALSLPDEADKQLDYCRQHGKVWDSNSGWMPEALQPGDLIFFAGPYDLPRESRVTHVMVYCGHNTMAGAQGLGRQQDGVIGGVGFYNFHPHYPNGVLGESGERFIGHMRVFAYGRVNNLGTPEQPHQAVAAAQKPTPAKSVTAAKSFGSSSRID